MTKRILALVLVTLFSFALSAATISFKGGESRLSLKEGKQTVVLSRGAYVKADSLSINSEKITLNGDDWRYITCEGLTTISDEERGLEIRTSHLWYDRIDELLIISAWFEIDDTKEQLSAQGGSLYYNMKDDQLELNMQVQLLKISDDAVMRCTAESVSYDRGQSLVSMRGGSRVSWKGDNYEAELISVDLNTDSIQLDGRIRGTING
ncbi:MAG: hypothetical protein KBS81_05910 [Spirochaetales bacterium]|nr:hypothetical protein [Candidatus Physcosoma equi]